MQEKWKYMSTQRHEGERTALFIMAKNWKQFKCPLNGKWMF